MREIKFRSYDYDFSEQRYVMKYFSLETLLAGYGNDCPDNPPGERVGYENIEEFTGLHDKDGKEIYEGDIIRAYTEIYGVFDVLVAFDMGSFGVLNHRASQVSNPEDWEYIHSKVSSYGFRLSRYSAFADGYSNIKESDKIEVIGNIHENPD